MAPIVGSLSRHSLLVNHGLKAAKNVYDDHGIQATLSPTLSESITLISAVVYSPLIVTCSIGFGTASGAEGTAGISRLRSVVICIDMNVTGISIDEAAAAAAAVAGMDIQVSKLDGRLLLLSKWW